MLEGTLAGGGALWHLLFVTFGIFVIFGMAWKTIPHITNITNITSSTYAVAGSAPWVPG